MLNFSNLHFSARTLLYWYIFIFFSTEILSYLSILERRYIFLAELIFWVVLIGWYRNKIFQSIKNFKPQSKNLLIMLSLFILTFLQGFFSAPNTTDSMVYHIPRVMYWIQEKTLTQDVIRNPHDFMAPFGEYIQLHLYFITGNDRLLFLSQWIAYIVSVILSGIIAEQLGANKKTKILTSLFVATIPMAIMQATSTQIDMVVSVLIMIGTHIALNLLKGFNIKQTILLGLTMGLGLSTKATFLLYLIIPVGITAFALIKNNFKGFLVVCLSALIALILPLRFMSQNLSLYGNILGPFKKGETLTNEIINIGSLISNLVRNLMIHIPVPFFKNQIQSSIDAFHKMIGMQINSPQTTCCDFQFHVISVIYPQEDIVSNPLHLLIFIFALFYVIKEKNAREMKIILVFMLTFFSLLIFSLILKWQPFHSRLHIPFFMLGTISSVLILSKFKIGLASLKMALFISVPLAFLLVFLNVSRPYISYTPFYNKIKPFVPPLSSVPESFITKPRESQYFNARYYWYDPYNKIIEMLEKKVASKTVSFQLMDLYEYPLWLLIKDKNLDYQVLPESKKLDDTIIISTSRDPYSLNGYTTECVKTKIEYGYACISIKNDNILDKKI